MFKISYQILSLWSKFTSESVFSNFIKILLDRTFFSLLSDLHYSVSLKAWSLVNFITLTNDHDVLFMEFWRLQNMSVFSKWILALACIIWAVAYYIIEQCLDASNLFFYNVYLGPFHHVFPGCFLVLSIFWPRQSWAWWPLPLQTSFISWQTARFLTSSVSWLMLPLQTSSISWHTVPLNICGRLVSPPFNNILHHIVNSSLKDKTPSASSSSGPPSSWRGTSRHWRFFCSGLHFCYFRS